MGDEEISEELGNRRKNRREAPILADFELSEIKKKKKRFGFDFFGGKIQNRVSEIKKTKNVSVLIFWRKNPKSILMRKWSRSKST